MTAVGNRPIWSDTREEFLLPGSELLGGEHACAVQCIGVAQLHEGIQESGPGADLEQLVQQVDLREHLRGCLAQPLQGLALAERAEPVDVQLQPAVGLNFEAELRVPPGLLQAFGEIWDRRNVADKVKDVKTLSNREVGVLLLHADRMWLQSRGGCRLTVFSPADDETTKSLERLHALAA
ncbi:hypothetical protein ABZ297_30855 [Nonomuraea sp. NPDC005983]|uniref:MmyB family transcriptional regulator n=1 Tax=Nonomuraea sp. NPDC005983 TaxID=3155595 RepID=UPI0033BBE43F